MFHKTEPDEISQLKEENAQLKKHVSNLQSMLKNTYMSFKEAERIQILEEELRSMAEFTFRGERYAERRQELREEIAAIHGQADIRQWKLENTK